MDRLNFRDYDTDGFYDELFAGDGQPREGAKLLMDRLESLPEGELGRRQHAAKQCPESRYSG